MSGARITQVRLRNFKSIGAEEQVVDLRPLTILIGRNNSGKSTVIQSLLLLKQTLEDPRPEVELSLQGTYLRAASLRELTHGWPEGASHAGPEITLRWMFTPDAPALEELLDDEGWLYDSPMAWLVKPEVLAGFHLGAQLEIEMTLRFAQKNAVVLAETISLSCRLLGEDRRCRMEIRTDTAQERRLFWETGDGTLVVDMDHFIPRPRWVGFDEEDRRLSLAFLALYEEPLRALKQLLASVSYIGASREEPPPYYAKPTSVPSRTILPTGSNAPEIIYGRQSDQVHIARLPEVENDRPFELIDRVTARPFKTAINDLLGYLGIDTSVSIHDAQEMGIFRLLFGRAPLNHVGRGVGHVLPVLVAGLLADPLLGDKDLPADLPLADYLSRCPIAPCLALEEIESHLHPKAQTRLAHIMVTLALSGRQLLVETHSDHLVRRLRGLVARSAPGSETEHKLRENVRVVEVEQKIPGVSVLQSAELTREGSIEQWPADFMDVASDEERAIYFAANAKSPPEPPPADAAFFEDVPSPGSPGGDAA